MITDAYSHYPRGHTDKSYSVLLLVGDLLKTFPDAYRFIGGWGPYVLCREHATLGPHVGSRDIDVLLLPERFPSNVYDTLAKALEGAGLKPKDGNRGSWRWIAPGSTPETDVWIDFIAPASGRKDHSSTAVIGGLKVSMLYGTGAVTSAHRVISRRGELWRLGTSLSVQLALANGAGVVAAKSIALDDRRARSEEHKTLKHAYDLYYLVTAYDRGTRALADEFRAIPDRLLRDEALSLLHTSFVLPDAVGPRYVSAFLGDRLPGREATERDVRQQFDLFVKRVRE